MRKFHGCGRNRRSPEFAWIFVWITLSCLAGCAARPKLEAPEVTKGHYMDEGATILVGDAALDQNQNWNSLPELLKKTSEDLQVESEKNSMLSEQLMATRESNDRLRVELEKTKREKMSLGEQILSLKNQMQELERELQNKMTEGKDLLEMLVNLKIEKNKLEKELIRIKIAALTGEG